MESYEQIVINADQVMEEWVIAEKTLYKHISKGDIPEPTYGGPWSRKHGWHKAVLKQAAIDKYNDSRIN